MKLPASHFSESKRNISPEDLILDSSSNTQLENKKLARLSVLVTISYLTPQFRREGLEFRGVRVCTWLTPKWNGMRGERQRRNSPWHGKQETRLFMGKEGFTPFHITPAVMTSSHWASPPNMTASYNHMGE